MNGMLRAFHLFPRSISAIAFQMKYETALVMEHGELFLQTFYERDIAHVPFFPRFIVANAPQRKYETTLAMEHGELLGRNMSCSLNSWKGFYGGVHRGQPWGLFRGTVRV